MKAFALIGQYFDFCCLLSNEQGHFSMSIEETKTIFKVLILSNDAHQNSGSSYMKYVQNSYKTL